MSSLVLGGGGAKGYIHLGVYDYLIKQQIVFGDIVGTSMGAIIGAMIALGWSYDDIYRQIERFALYKIVGIPNKHGMIPYDKVLAYARDLFGDAQFADCRIPLSVIAYDITQGRKIVFRDGPLINALIASACIPGVFSPYLGNQQSLIMDGGIAHNLDCQSAQSDDIIAVSLMGASKALAKNPSMMKLSLRSLYHLIRQNEDFSLYQATQEGKHITLIRPDLSEYEMYHFDKYKKLIQIGYEEMKKATEGSKK